MNIIGQIKTFSTGALKAMNRHRMEIAAGAGVFSIWITKPLATDSGQGVKDLVDAFCRDVVPNT